MDKNQNTNNPEDGRGPSLLHQCNGNYLLAASKHIERLPLPAAVRKVLKAILIIFILVVIAIGLFWPWLW